MSDNVRMLCPNLRCRSVLAVPGSARGQVVRCRKCGTRVKVPANAGLPAKSEAAANGTAPTGAGTKPAAKSAAPPVKG